MTRNRTLLVVLCSAAITCSALAQGGGPDGAGPRGRPRPEDGRRPGPGPGPGGPGGRPRPDRDRDRDNPPDGFDDLRPRGRMSPDAQRDLDAFWEDNKQKIVEFCKENSPARWRTFERRIGEVSDYRAPRDKLLIQLRHLMELEKSDTELYKIKVAQIRAEDAEYRLTRELSWARERGTADDIQRIRGDLRNKANESVTLRLDERQLRLSRLQKRLEDEQQRLARDRENAAAMVDAHVEEVIRTPPGPLPLRRGQTTTSQPQTAPPATPGAPN
jgi:hypothetical protein